MNREEWVKYMVPISGRSAQEMELMWEMLFNRYPKVPKFESMDEMLNWLEES